MIIDKGQGKVIFVKSSIFPGHNAAISVRRENAVLRSATDTSENVVTGGGCTQ